MRRLLLTALAAFAASSSDALAEDRHSANMSLLKNIPYAALHGDTPNYGTDIEFAKIGSRRYALAGSELNGLHVVDITKPASATEVATFDCAVSQGDVQVFKRGTRTLMTYTNDYEDNEQAAKSECYRQAVARGFDAVNADGTARLGTLIFDISKPTQPRTVSFVEIPKGSHNMTVHPSGGFLYNSNSELITSLAPAIEVFDIRKLAAPTKTADVTLTALPGLGTESHDITFSDDGTRGYSAALSHGVILNTEDAAHPTVVSEYDDEAINVWHQSDPFTIRDENGAVVRKLLIVEDELAGAAGPGVCPTGGVHIYDVADETAPVKVGYFNIDDVQVGAPTDTCTAHVFDIHEDEQVMTIAYYMGGVRVLDLSGLADAPIGVGQGATAVGGAIREVGFYDTENANTWSAKTPLIEKDGSFHLYGNDINRGLDVYRYDASAAPSAGDGTFLSAAQSQLQLKAAPGAARRGRVFCLLPR